MKSLLQRVKMEIFINLFNDDLRSLSTWEGEEEDRAAESHVSAVSKQGIEVTKVCSPRERSRSNGTECFWKFLHKITQNISKNIFLI